MTLSFLFIRCLSVIIIMPLMWEMPLLIIDTMKSCWAALFKFLSPFSVDLLEFSRLHRETFSKPGIGMLTFLVIHALTFLQSITKRSTSVFIKCLWLCCRTDLSVVLSGLYPEQHSAWLWSVPRRWTALCNPERAPQKNLPFDRQLWCFPRSEACFDI